MAEIAKKRLEQVAVWSVVGILATVVMGILALWITTRQAEPAIRFTILQESNVLDLHQPVKDLAISYRGEDIQAQNKNLRIITVRAENTGDTDIRQGDYDQNQAWGLEVCDAEIVERPKVVDSNSDYILENLRPQVDKAGVIEFRKIIFERGKFFVIEFQVLHELANRPRIQAVGKITGIQEQPVILATAQQAEPGLWHKVFWGETSVQIARALAFLVAAVVLVAGVLVLIAFVMERRDRRKRRRMRRKVRDYLALLLEGKTESQRETILAVVRETNADVGRLTALLEFISSPEQLHAASQAGLIVADLEKSIATPMWYQWVDLTRRLSPVVRVNDQTGEFEARADVAKVLAELIAYVKARPMDEATSKLLRSVGTWRYFMRDAGVHGPSELSLATPSPDPGARGGCGG